MFNKKTSYTIDLRPYLPAIINSRNLTTGIVNSLTTTELKDYAARRSSAPFEDNVLTKGININYGDAELTKQTINELHSCFGNELNECAPARILLRATPPS